VGRRGYSPEFRRKVLDLLDAGRSVVDVARDLGISTESIYTWRRQDRIDRGLVPGLASVEKAELFAARKRIAELEAEVAIHRRASELLARWCPQKAVRGHRGDGRGGTPGSGRDPGPGDLGAGVLRLADPTTIGPIDPARDPDRRDPSDPRRLERHLRFAPRPRRARPGPRDPGLARDGVDADGARRAQGHRPGDPSGTDPTRT
jgi:transposase